MFNISPNAVALFFVSNFIWFFFTAYIIVTQIKREKKAQRMIDRLSESNEYLNDELSGLREEYIKVKRKHDEMQIAIHSAVNAVSGNNKEMNNEIH